MTKIAARAEVLDKRLQRLNSTISKVDKESDHMATSWERKMARLRAATDTAASDINSDLKGVSDRLTTMSRHRYRIRVDADTSRARDKLNELHRMARRTSVLGRAAGSTAGGGLAGFLMGRAAVANSGRTQRVLGSLAGGFNSLGNTFDRVGVNLGPLSARLSTLPLLLAAIAPPAIAAIASALSVLAGAISAVGVAAVGATGLVGAFAAGIASIAVPMIYATKKLSDKNKAVDKYKKALDRAELSLKKQNKYTKDGTEVAKGYTNALDRRNRALKSYKDALSRLSKPERSAIHNLRSLRGEWERLIIKGKSGERAMSMANSALVFARLQLPVLAKWMDRFSASADNLFKSMIKNSPRFRRNLEAATATWPKRFEEMGRATGFLTEGLLGLLRAAQPLMRWMSGEILKLTKSFDKWANSVAGQRAMKSFFATVTPIIEEVVGLFWDFGAAIIDLTRRDAGDIIYFIGELRSIIKSLPSYIDKMTDAFRDLWPDIRKTGALLFRAFALVAPWVDRAFHAISRLTDFLSGLSDRQLKWVLALSGLMTSSKIRAGVWKSIAWSWASMAKSSKTIAASNAAMAMLPIGTGRGTKGKGLGSTWLIAPPVSARGGFASAARGAGILGAAPEAGSGAAAISGAYGGAGAAASGGGAAAAAGAGTALAIAAVVAAEAAAAWYAWKTNFGKIQEYTAGVWARVKDNFAQAGEYISQIFNELGLKNKGFSDLVSKGFGAIKWVIKGIGFVLLRSLGGAFEGVSVIAESFFGAVLSFTRLFKGAVKVWVNLLTFDFGGAWKALKGIVTDVKGAIIGTVNSIKDAIVAVANFFGVNIGKQGGGLSLKDVPDSGGKNGAFTPAQNPAIPDSSPFSGKPRQGDGVGEKASDAYGWLKAAPGKVWDKTGGRIQALLEKFPAGMVGGVAKGAMKKVASAAVAKIKDTAGGMFAGGSKAVSGGLNPVAAAAASALSRMFGVRLTSGFRSGSVTEFGNQSLHSLGRAIDLGGTASQMQAVFDFLQGKPGIQELIYNGKASYNGGPVVGYSGSDKHTDHVHVGFGDGRGVPTGGAQGARAGVNITFTGDVIISDGSSYQQFAEKLTSEIERAMRSMTNENASEMIQ